MGRQSPNDGGSHFTNEELETAVGIWKEATRADPEALLYAKQVFREWRVEVKDELRGLPRTSNPSARYRELKKLEERLEAQIMDCHEAWMDALSKRRFA